MPAMTTDFHLAGGPKSAFRVRLLPPGDLRLALPLAQLLYPFLTERAWFDYAKQPQNGEQRRILVACDPRGYLHGLCTLSDGFDLRCGRSLDVDDFVVASFVDTKSVAEVLLAGIEEIARTSGYQEVRVMLADSNLPHRQAVADTLNSGGHVRTMARFTKPLAQPPRPMVSL
jgi:hypothetical protein